MTKPNVTITLAGNGDAAEVQRLVLAADRKAIDVRLAQNKDGDDIHGLVSSSGQEISGLDWSDIYPYWLVVEMDGRIVGCLQVCAGKPMGRLDWLAYDQGLSHQSRARVIKIMVDQGFLVLKLHGAQIVACMVDFEDKAFKRILKKRGGVVMVTGNLIVRRLV